MKQYTLKRERMGEEFQKLFDYPLTLAVAAMGYGKTTSARDFFNDNNVPYIWLTVDSDEASPQFIWDSLMRQLSKVQPEAARQLRALGFPSDALQRDKLIRIIEDATYMTGTVLVIDDYHNIRSPEFNKLMERLVRTKIPGFHILLLSRIIPEISVDELLLKGYCYLIKSSWFDMTELEVSAFFSLYGYDISAKTTKQIFALSEGWISAVYLILQEYIETGNISPGQSVERLIETSVMKRYPSKEALLLRALSALDSFTPKQSVYVTGEPDAERMLRSMSNENSFIRYDGQENVYRIHNVLGGYLRKLLEIEFAEKDIRALYRRAGEWCVQNEDVLTGLKYLLKAREYQLILDEFEKSVNITRLMDSSAEYIMEIFEQIPEDIRRLRPIAYLAYTGFYVTNVDREAGSRLLSELEQAYEGDRLPEEMQRRIHGETELIRAYIAFNNAPLMREHFIKAHALLDGRSSVANERKIITFGSPHALYLYYRDAGGLRAAKEWVQNMFCYYTEMAHGCGRGFDDLLEAEYLLETGILDKAELYACRAEHKARSLEQTAVLICSAFTLARIYSARGDFEQALALMAELRGEVAADGPILSSALDVCFGYIAGIAGRADGLGGWLFEGALEQSEILYQGMGFCYIAYGKFLLQKRDFIRLELLCEQMEQVFAPFRNQLGYLHAHLLSAIAKSRIYGMEQALPSLSAALEIGRGDGLILPLAEYGAELYPLLETLHREGGADDYVSLVTEHVRSYAENRSIFDARAEKGTVLTPRERETLGLLIEGKSNGEIASALFIAEVTVRKNITAIYRKLAVSGRAAAVRKALEMKIL